MDGGGPGGQSLRRGGAREPLRSHLLVSRRAELLVQGLLIGLPVSDLLPCPDHESLANSCIPGVGHRAQHIVGLQSVVMTQLLNYSLDF